MKFREVLRDLRLKAGLTQEKLSELSGIPVSSIRGHEQGQRLPSWGSVVRLSKALGVSCEAFSECDELLDEPPTDAPAPEPSTGKKAGRKTKETKP